MPSLNEIIKSYNKRSGQGSAPSLNIEEKATIQDPFGTFVKCMTQVLVAEQTKAQEQEQLKILNEKKEAESTKKHLNSFFSTVAETLKEEVAKKQTTEENKEQEEEPKSDSTDTSEQSEPTETKQEDAQPTQQETSTNSYVDELSKASKTLPLSKEAEEENKLKGLVSKQLTEEVNKIRQLFPNFGMSGSGGGTNAVQYANGGTMNGDLNVMGRYLSGGIDLIEIFRGAGGFSTGFASRSQIINEAVVDGGFYT